MLRLLARLVSVRYPGDVTPDKLDSDGTSGVEDRESLGPKRGDDLPVEETIFFLRAAPCVLLVLRMLSLPGRLPLPSESGAGVELRELDIESGVPRTMLPLLLWGFK